VFQISVVNHPWSVICRPWSANKFIFLKPNNHFMKKFLVCAAVVCIAVSACNDNAKKETAVSTDTTKTATTADKPAADVATPPLDSAAMMKAWMAYAAPGEQHKMLAAQNGVWNEEIKMYMEDGKVDSMKSVCTNTMALNGLFQKSSTKGMYMGMPFEGLGTLGYDNASKKWQSTWMDNMGSGMIYMEGDYDDRTKMLSLSGTHTDPITAKQTLMRQTMKMIDDKNQYIEMFDTKNGKEMKVMEIKLSRK
jgi:hypothetical protein